MKNREKYRDEILNSVFRGNGEAYCEFAKKNVLQNLTDCTNGECDEFQTCWLCRVIFAFWLDEEYEEPEVDWSNVPVDTLVRVRDLESEEWTLRYFKGINACNQVERFVAWADGKTSVTANGSCTNWAFCELVEDEKAVRHE